MTSMGLQVLVFAVLIGLSLRAEENLAAGSASSRRGSGGTSAGAAFADPDPAYHRGWWAPAAAVAAPHDSGSIGHGRSCLGTAELVRDAMTGRTGASAAGALGTVVGRCHLWLCAGAMRAREVESLRQAVRRRRTHADAGETLRRRCSFLRPRRSRFDPVRAHPATRPRHSCGGGHPFRHWSRCCCVKVPVLSWEPAPSREW